MKIVVFFLLALFSLSTPLQALDGYNPQQIVNQTQRLPYRMVQAIGSGGKTLEMDDGSIWQIIDFSKQEAKRWLPNDYIVIYPTWNTWFHGCRFWIHNTRRDSYAFAELSLGPIINGPCTNQIIYINYHLGQITLRDARGYQNVWQISTCDRDKISRWQLGDALIIGSNDCFSGQCMDPAKYLLIHTRENTIIKADCLY